MTSTYQNAVLSSMDFMPLIFNFFDDQTHSSALNVCKQWGPWVCQAVKKQKKSFLIELCMHSLVNQSVISSLNALNLKMIDNQFTKNIHQIFVKCQPSTLPTTKALFLKYSYESTYNKIMEEESTLATLETIFQCGGLKSAIDYIDTAFKENTRKKLYSKYIKKSDLIQQREYFKSLKVLYENEMNTLSNLLEDDHIEQAFKYYREHPENPILHLAFLTRITFLVSKNNLAEAKKIINKISEPFIQKQAQGILDSSRTEEFLNDISENLKYISSLEECQAFEKTTRELQLSPACFYFAQSMIVSCYVSLDHGIESVKEILKVNPDNYFIGPVIVMNIRQFCKINKIEMAEKLYPLLTEEKDSKLAEFYINLAKTL